jgi:hypothetical protein
MASPVATFSSFRLRTITSIHDPVRDAMDSRQTANFSPSHGIAFAAFVI